MFDCNRLPNAVPDEHTIYVLRRHPITLASLMVTFALLLGAPVAIILYFSQVRPDFLESPVAMPLLVLGGSVFFLFSWLFLFQQFLDWYLDLWIVTNRRILNIEQTGLFSRTVSELRLYRIQDVTSTVNGIVATVFDFGDLEIQTAGEKSRFDFEEIPHPTVVAKAILELSEADRKDHLDEAVEEFGMVDRDSKEEEKGSAAKRA
jgi:uncharacterized membrane protein YdbT with pleckstrin-like domain